MPHFWDYYFSKGDGTASSSSASSSSTHRNLQDGLFQIATQTCNLLVQVNNTNNISYGGNSMNISCNSIPSPSSINHANNTTDGNLSQEQEQLLVLIPPVNGKGGARFKQTGTIKRPRLSVSITVLANLVKYLKKKMQIK